MDGLVVRNTGSWYHVQTENGDIVECKIKGNLRLKDIKTTNPIAVGDRVTFTVNENEIGMISEIHDRKNYIVRRSSNLSKQAHILASNIDMVALVVTINYPKTSNIFIDRFLASAEAYRVPACIVVNKSDLYIADEVDQMNFIKNLYNKLGYRVIIISVKEKTGFDELINCLEGKTTLISGNSGVGKSSIINILSPVIGARVGEISSYHNKGMHTTTFSEMYHLQNGTKVIDTPGIKGFGVVDMKTEEISHYFKEIFTISKQCKFSNCTHIHEPGCAVIKAVETNEINISRYESYRSMLFDDDNGKYR